MSVSSANANVLKASNEALNVALVSAAHHGRVIEVGELIKQKANVNVQICPNPDNSDFWKPLLVHVGEKSKENDKCLDVMKLLIQAKADVNAPDCFGESAALMTMITFRCVAALQILLDNQVDLSGDKLETAIQMTQSIQVRDLWKDEGAAMEKMLRTRETPQLTLNRQLTTAALDGHVHDVAQLIQKKANVDTWVILSYDTNKMSPWCHLTAAVALKAKENEKCLQIMQLLIEVNATLDSDEREIVRTYNNEAFQLLKTSDGAQDQKKN